MAVALLFETTVSSYDGSRTHNLGLLQMQMVILHSALGVLVSGAVFSSVGRLIERLESGGAITPPPVQKLRDFNPEDHIA